MKILGFEFRKLETKTTTVECVDTWCVKWYSIHHDVSSFWEAHTEIMSFTSKETADMFAKELKDSCRLLKNELQNIRVYKQSHPINL